MKLKKILNFATKITIAKIFNYKIPLRVKQYITYRCNLSCLFCARRAVTKTEMTTPQIKKMMEEFKDMGTVFWEFTGGEPLLREDLAELVDYAKDSMGFHLSLATNGTLLPERINKYPALRKFDFIQISFEGRKEINDKLRGKNVFDKVIQALQMLKKYNIKTKISTVITKDNLQDCNYLVNIAERYGTGIAFEPIAIHPQDRQLLARQYFPDKKTFQEFIDILVKEKQDDAPIESSLEYLRTVRESWPDGANLIKCYAGKFLCDITPDGYVVPCCVRLENARDECCGLKHGFGKAFLNLGDLTHCNLSCFCSGPQEINIVLNMLPLKIHRIIKNYANTNII